MILLWHHTLPSGLLLATLCVAGGIALSGCDRSATASDDPQLAAIHGEADLPAVVAWLWAEQDPDGAWRSDHYAYFRAGHALTPFVLHALLQVPDSRARRPADGVERALDFIRTTIAADGSVGVGGLPTAEYPNYSSAFALRCLVAAGDESDAERIDRLAVRLIAEQYRTENGFGPADPVHGGWGFGIRPPGGAGHMDLSITRHVLEALTDAGVVAKDAPLRARAEQFLRFVQRHPDELRVQPPVAGSQIDGIAPPFDGGFYFSPIMAAINKGGTAVDPSTGRSYYRSYASATAEGLLALLSLGFDASDPRVEAARRWLVEDHPRLDRHEGIPDDEPNGWRDALTLYHLSVRAEAHAIVGGPAGWRELIARELAPFQRPDGAVANLAGALMKEDDPLLGSALAVVALSASGR